MSNAELMPMDEPQSRSQAITATTPAALLAIAVNQGADLDRLDKLMALQERWEANEARKAYVSAMAAFKAEPMEILKRKLVSFTTRDGDTTSYHHAELSDVTDAVVPAMGKHGLSHRWDVTQQSGSITVTCQVTHRLGHVESVSMTAAPDASGKKNAIQQVASTVTYLQRYTLLALTGMATKGMDDDGRGYDAEPEAEQPTYADWHAAITGESTVDGLKRVKNELVGKFGDAIPKVLVDACVTRMSAIKGGAK